MTRTDEMRFRDMHRTVRGVALAVAGAGLLTVVGLTSTASAAAPGAQPTPSRGCGAGQAAVIGDGVRVHTQPNTTSSVLGLLYKGQRVSVTDICNVQGAVYKPVCAPSSGTLRFWVPIRYAGRTGYFVANCERLL